MRLSDLPERKKALCSALKLKNYHLRTAVHSLSNTIASHTEMVEDVSHDALRLLSDKQNHLLRLQRQTTWDFFFFLTEKVDKRPFMNTPTSVPQTDEMIWN